MKRFLKRHKYFEKEKHKWGPLNNINHYFYLYYQQVPCTFGKKNPLMLASNNVLLLLLLLVLWRFRFYWFFLFCLGCLHIWVYKSDKLLPKTNISKIVLLFRVSYIELPNLLPIFQVYILLCVSNIIFVFQFNLLLILQNSYHVLILFFIIKLL